MKGITDKLAIDAGVSRAMYPSEAGDKRAFNDFLMRELSQTERYSYAELVRILEGFKTHTATQTIVSLRESTIGSDSDSPSVSLRTTAGSEAILINEEKIATSHSANAPRNDIMEDERDEGAEELGMVLLPSGEKLKQMLLPMKFSIEPSRLWPRSETSSPVCENSEGLFHAAVKNNKLRILRPKSVKKALLKSEGLDEEISLAKRCKLVLAQKQLGINSSLTLEGAAYDENGILLDLTGLIAVYEEKVGVLYVYRHFSGKVEELIEEILRSEVGPGQLELFPEENGTAGEKEQAPAPEELSMVLLPEIFGWIANVFKQILEIFPPTVLKVILVAVILATPINIAEKMKFGPYLKYRKRMRKENPDYKTLKLGRMFIRCLLAYLTGRWTREEVDMFRSELDLLFKRLGVSDRVDAKKVLGMVKPIGLRDYAKIASIFFFFMLFISTFANIFLSLIFKYSFLKGQVVATGFSFIIFVTAICEFSCGMSMQVGGFYNERIIFKNKKRNRIAFKRMWPWASRREHAFNVGMLWKITGQYFEAERYLKDKRTVFGSLVPDALFYIRSSELGDFSPVSRELVELYRNGDEEFGKKMATAFLRDAKIKGFFGFDSIAVSDALHTIRLFTDPGSVRVPVQLLELELKKVTTGKEAREQLGPVVLTIGVLKAVIDGVVDNSSYIAESSFSMLRKVAEGNEWADAAEDTLKNPLELRMAVMPGEILSRYSQLGRARTRKIECTREIFISAAKELKAQGNKNPRISQIAEKAGCTIPSAHIIFNKHELEDEIMALGMHVNFTGIKLKGKKRAYRIKAIAVWLEKKPGRKPSLDEVASSRGWDKRNLAVWKRKEGFSYEDLNIADPRAQDVFTPKDVFAPDENSIINAVEELREQHRFPGNFYYDKEILLQMLGKRRSSSIPLAILREFLAARRQFCREHSIVALVPNTRISDEILELKNNPDRDELLERLKEVSWIEYKVLLYRLGLHEKEKGYQNPLTLKAIGIEYDLTHERIRQIKVNGFTDIKRLISLPIESPISPIDVAGALFLMPLREKVRRAIRRNNNQRKDTQRSPQYDGKVRDIINRYPPHPRYRRYWRRKEKKRDQRHAKAFNPRGPRTSQRSIFVDEDAQEETTGDDIQGEDPQHFAYEDDEDSQVDLVELNMALLPVSNLKQLYPRNINRNIFIFFNSSETSPDLVSSKVIAEYLFEHIDLTGKKVADIGSGSGVQSIIAAEMGADNILAVDNSSEAVEDVRVNLKAAGFSEKIRTSLGDTWDSVAPEERFDLIISTIPMHEVYGFLEQAAERIKDEKSRIILLGHTTPGCMDMVRFQAHELGLRIVNEPKLNNGYTVFEIAKHVSVKDDTAAINMALLPLSFEGTIVPIWSHKKTEYGEEASVWTGKIESLKINGKSITLKEPLIVASRVQVDKGADKAFFRNVIASALDEVFLKEKRYTISHIPEVLGRFEQGYYYVYVYSGGREYFPSEHAMVDGPALFTSRREEKQAVEAFNTAGICINYDVLDAHGEVVKNVILKHFDQDEVLRTGYYPKEWYRIDFGMRSITYYHEKLCAYLSANKQMLEEKLGAKSRMLELAYKKLSSDFEGDEEEEFFRLFAAYQLEVLSRNIPEIAGAIENTDGPITIEADELEAESLEFNMATLPEMRSVLEKIFGKRKMIISLFSSFFLVGLGIFRAFVLDDNPGIADGTVLDFLQRKAYDGSLWDLINVQYFKFLTAPSVVSLVYLLVFFYWMHLEGEFDNIPQLLFTNRLSRLLIVTMSTAAASSPELVKWQNNTSFVYLEGEDPVINLIAIAAGAILMYFIMPYYFFLEPENRNERDEGEEEQQAGVTRLSMTVIPLSMIRIEWVKWSEWSELSPAFKYGLGVSVILTLAMVVLMTHSIRNYYEYRRENAGAFISNFRLDAFSIRLVRVVTGLWDKAKVKIANFAPVTFGAIVVAF